MIKNIYKISIFILVVIVSLGFSRYYKFDEYKPAMEDGVKNKCSELFGATETYAVSKKYKDECWSCPAGFKSNPNRFLGDPVNKKHCRQKNSKYVDAIYHSKPTGVFKKCATKDVWYKNKKCWTCPKGYKPARIKEGDGRKAQCKPDNRFIFRPAIKRGDAGCTDGAAWSPVLSKKCYKCPEGFDHNLVRIPLKIDPAKDPKTCKREVTLMDSLLESD